MNTLRLSIYILTLTALALATVLPVHAGLYKWEDDAGNTHYSQIPPTGRPSQKIDAISSSPVTTTDVQADEDDLESTPPSDHPSTAGTQLLPQSCDALRRQITLLETNPRVRIRDEKTGKLTVLSPEEKQAKINNYKTQLKNSCQEPG